MADIIKEEYKRLGCYTKMDPPDQATFDTLAQHYGSILNRGPVQTITVYTSHDFDRHCFDLYRIISMFLLQEEGLQHLSKEELYLLNLSVLLHDISMCMGGYDSENKTNTPFNRDIHALQSAQWIQYEFSKRDTLLYTSGLTADQVEIICDICKAHSSLKDRTTPSGLFDPELRYKKDGKTGAVRTKALAGILRIADELDVTRHRLANADEMERLLIADDGRQEVQTFIRENKESLKHFRRLLLIRKLERCADNTTQLILKLDNEQARKRQLAGDAENLADDLYEIQSKIQSELDTLWGEVLSKESSGARSLTTVKTVVWDKDDELYIYSLCPNEASAPSMNLSPIEVESSNITDEVESALSSSWKSGNIDIELLNPELSQKIGRYIREERLFDVGHYKLNMTYCARDWINTECLLNNSELSSDIISACSDHIWSSYRTEKFTLVGLDLLGAKLAAQIGFILKKPFTYVIPAHQYTEVDSHEVDIPDIPDEHKVVLVTDSTITGLTTSNIIQENHWEDRILSVYTVFYRRPKVAKNSELPITLPCVVRALNVDFPAEIALVSDCPYGDNHDCHAINQKLK